MENGTFGIDTISHGVLTAMSFPDFQVIQSGKGIAGNCPDSRNRFGHAAS
jgi:hypothetical protein